jgi:UDP-N-acetylglucosamine diphosphorylase/glucosamine-1-phosphate N-acetyltransferase
MNIIFFDDTNRDTLLPLSFTKPVAELRVGILSIREKWERRFNATASFITEEYLSQKFPLKTQEDNLVILGGLIPGTSIVEKIKNLKPGSLLETEGRIIAGRLNENQVLDFMSDKNNNSIAALDAGMVQIIDFPWQIFSLNGQEIITDFEFITKNRRSQKLSPSNNCLGNNIFIEEGAKAEFATFNTESGPVYLGKDSEVMEGSIVRGPFALCEHSSLKLGAKIYGPTTIGPFSKAGGEINNSVIQAYSNKGHDGFLGNSVIGEWCNIGADSNNSNLKNNYAEVKLWSYPQEKFINTGLQFCGLIMADHSKCGINTMFNTGTVVGVNANIYGSGFPRNFIPSFSWGGASGLTTFNIQKAFEVAEKVMARRNIQFNDIEKEILAEVFRMTEKYRK